MRDDATLLLARDGAIRYTTVSLREKHHANVAQLVEQRTRNAQVSGSNPLVGSRICAGQQVKSLLACSFFNVQKLAACANRVPMG